MYVQNHSIHVGAPVLEHIQTNSMYNNNSAINTSIPCKTRRSEQFSFGRVVYGGGKINAHSSIATYLQIVCLSYTTTYYQQGNNNMTPTGNRQKPRT